MSNRDLKYKIFGDNLLGRSVNGAIGALGRLSRAGMSAASSMVTGMGRIMKRGLQVGFAGTIAGAIWSVKDAMAVGEMESKFDAVFKNLKDSARDWSKDFASSVKRSEYDVRGWMSSIQDTLVPMGVARDEASKLAREITALGVDLGSFNDMDAGEAIERIIGTLVGNHENVRKFGVVITEAAMKQKALEMGLAKANEPLSEQAKLLVRLRMIQDGTTDAQGDAVRTAGSLANRWKGLLSVFKTFRVEVGNQIVEGLGLASVFGAIEKSVGSLIERLKESNIVEQWAANLRGVATTIAATAQALADPERRADTAKALGGVFRAMMIDAVSAAASLLMKVAPTIGSMIGVAAKAAFDPFQERDIRQAAKQLGIEMGMVKGAFGMISGVSDEDETAIRKEARRIRYERDLKNMGIDPDSMESTGSKTQDAWNALNKVVAKESRAIEQALQVHAAPIQAAVSSPPGATPASAQAEKSAAARNVTSMGLGEVFTRFQFGNKGKRSYEERMINLQEEANRHLKEITKKEGGLDA